MDIYKEELVIEVEEIKKILDLMSSLFGIRTAFIFAISDREYRDDIAGNYGDYQDYCRIIQQEFKHKCIACDRDKFKEASIKKMPLLYRCYNGLYEMFLPIFIENSLVGYLHFGQVRGENNFNSIAEEHGLYEHTNVAALEKSYDSMNIIKKEKLVMISEIFLRISDIILKNKLIEIRKAKPEYYLKKYIEENLDKPIEIKTAAEFIGRSPSFVTHNFKKTYGISFHNYLNKIRIEHSKHLLRKHSISETSKLCGYKNRFHFSKIFKNVEGVTPHEYQSNSEQN